MPLATSRLRLIGDDPVKEVPPDEKKRRAEDLYSYLRSLPQTNTMILYYDGLVEKLSSFEVVLNKLQAFVRFLSKLTSEKYGQWMEKAFAGFKAVISSPQMTDTTVKEMEQSSDDFAPVINEMLSDAKEQKKTKKRRFKLF